MCCRAFHPSLKLNFWNFRWTFLQNQLSSSWSFFRFSNKNTNSLLSDQPLFQHKTLQKLMFPLIINLFPGRSDGRLVEHWPELGFLLKCAERWALKRAQMSKDRFLTSVTSTTPFPTNCILDVIKSWPTSPSFVPQERFQTTPNFYMRAQDTSPSLNILCSSETV